MSIKWASDPHVHVACQSCGEGHTRGPVSREGQRQGNRWPWVREACAVRKEAGCRGPGSFLEEVASAEGLWSFLSPFKKKKNAFLPHKDSIQIVLKGTKQKSGVTLLQSGHHLYCKSFQIPSVLTHRKAELPQHKWHRPCGEPGFSERTKRSLDWIFCREPMAVGGLGSRGEAWLARTFAGLSAARLGTGARPRRPSVPPQRPRILFCCSRSC